LVCILEINIDDSKEIYKSGFGGNYIGILPASSESLRERVKIKSKSSTESVNKILFEAQDEIKEIENSSFFTNRLINDNLEDSYLVFKNRIISIYPFVKNDYDFVEKLAKAAVATNKE
jgi:guanylate kinase